MAVNPGCFKSLVLYVGNLYLVLPSCILFLSICYTFT